MAAMTYNCECDDGQPTVTLEEMRLRIARRLGFATQVAMGVLPPGMADLLDDFVRSAHELLYRRYAVMRQERFFTWDLVAGTRFYDLDPAVPTLKIGYTWYAPRVQRTGLNTETKLLLLEHAFEALGCASVFFETSWFNHASRTAIARLGAKQDGVLRNHKRHADGSLRDTVVFSLIDGEWPAARRHLQFKLDSHP